MEETETTITHPENVVTPRTKVLERLSSAFYRFAGKAILAYIYKDWGFLHPNSYHPDRWEKLVERHGDPFSWYPRMQNIG